MRPFVASLFAVLLAACLLITAGCCNKEGGCIKDPPCKPCECPGTGAK